MNASRYLLSLIAGLCVLKGHADSQNILNTYNPGFELGQTFWRFFEVPENIGSRISVITTDAAEGSKAVRIDFIKAYASIQDRGFDNWEANIPVRGNTFYTASVQAKASGTGAFALSIVFGFFNRDRAVLDQTGKSYMLSSSWQAFGITATAPKGAAFCWIAFRLYDTSGNRAAGSLFLDDVRIAAALSNQQPFTARVMPTLLPSEDVPVASIDVTLPPFNADISGTQDASDAFQDAIHQAANGGGGVVFVPAGTYRFDGTLLLREKVVLRGEWENPDMHPAVRGTILMVYAGAGQASGTPFISLERGSGVRNLSIWYPDQNLSSVTPYPWTFQCHPNTPSGTGDNTSLMNITIVNAYQAIKVGPLSNELHYIRNVYGTPLRTGIWMDHTTDIGRLIDVHFSPGYWSGSGLQRAPAASSILSWLQNNAEGIVMGRSDWEYVYRVSLIGYHTGIRIFKYSDTGPNGVMYGLRIEKGQIGIRFQEVNEIGFAITGSSIQASEGKTPACVWADVTFTSIVQFNRCSFGGRPKEIVHFEENAKGRMTFQNCTFADWGYQGGSAAIHVGNGSVAVLKSVFQQEKTHFYFGKNVTHAQILDNTFPSSPIIDNRSLSDEILLSRESLEMPVLDAPPHPFAEFPRPVSNHLCVVQDYGALGNGVTDDTQAFQTALNAAGQRGGGTVYVPAGAYRIEAHLDVPAGVELRGMWDVPHHTISKGSVLYAYEGKENSSGTPFVSLAQGSGIRGMTIWYPEQDSRNIHAYPWTIQTKGTDCWIQDVTLGNSYQGVDLGSFPSDRHRVSYLAGEPLKTGIFVSRNSGEGWIENVQFNPHYYIRSTGYPKPDNPSVEALKSYNQHYLEAFKFGACRREHIFGNFVYAANKGLYFVDDGGGCNADVYFHGTDAGSYGIAIDGCGEEGLIFINSQLVLLGGFMEGAITTGPSFSGRAEFYNTLAWGATDGKTAHLTGRGTATLQQLSTRMHRFNVSSGTAKLHNIQFQNIVNPQYTIGSGVDKVEIFGNHGAGGFHLQNQAGDRVEADYNAGQKHSASNAFGTGWETSDPVNDWNNTLYDSQHINAASGKVKPFCQAVEKSDRHTGDFSLEVTAKDTSTQQSLVYFKVFDCRFKVLGSTEMHYWFFPKNALGRYVHMDLLFTDGTRLSDFRPVYHDSASITEAHGGIGQWMQMRCSVGQYASGKTVKTVMAGYAHDPEAGDFSAFLDDFALRTSQLLPEGWQVSDIGNALPKGYTVFDGNQLFQIAGGSGLRFLGDECHFTYRRVAGDITLTARFENWSGSMQAAFTGLMLRESDYIRSPMVSLNLSPSVGLRTSWRLKTTSSVQSETHGIPDDGIPKWLKLVRQGDSLATFYSVDGNTWGDPLKKIWIPMDSTVWVGIAGSSGVVTETVLAEYSNIKLLEYAETGVSSVDTDQLPDHFALYPNFPNPFNHQTMIQYDVPVQSKLQLLVYDILGRQVRELWKGKQTPGQYRILWDGLDDLGLPVSSGIYLCEFYAEPRYRALQKFLGDYPLCKPKYKIIKNSLLF